MASGGVGKRVRKLAEETIARCRLVAGDTEELGFTTRTFLSAPMHTVHQRFSAWMKAAGMAVSVDAVGNLHGLYSARAANPKRLIIASHLDTVPRAGAFDGILGVTLGVALVESLERRPLNFEIEVIGFSEEEGVRFGLPFIGSLALIGEADSELLSRRDSTGIRVRDAIAAFGLDSSRIDDAITNANGYLEFHIEQGPVLEKLGLSLGVVEAIAGQSRLDVVFEGKANHAGTTPMGLRQDALAGAAEWIGIVEREGAGAAGLVATVGRLDVVPGAGNVIAGRARASLDVRHANDQLRREAQERILDQARTIAVRRGLTISWTQHLDQTAVPMNPEMTRLLESAVSAAGHPVHRLTSGAGHDAMIVARRLPAAMLFLRSPGGISHHPDETVLVEDVAAALEAGRHFLGNIGEQWEEHSA